MQIYRYFFKLNDVGSDALSDALKANNTVHLLLNSLHEFDTTCIHVDCRALFLGNKCATNLIYLLGRPPLNAH